MKFPDFSDRTSAALILLASSLLVSLSGGLGRVDNILYDFGQKLQNHTGPQDLVIVAIDEESLSRLGRWPWSRHLHAGLIDRLNNDGARVIGMDLIFAEPDAVDPAADIALDNAIQRAGNVVLPVLLENNRVNGQMIETLPLPQLAEHAAAMGRVHVELDEDGIARSVFLLEGVGTPAWPLFAQAVLSAGHVDSPVQTASLPNASQHSPHPFALSREDQRRITFLGPPGYVQSLSYAQVLKGEFPKGLFKDKIVLVGATAAGMGDQLPTPVSGLRQPMSGVEFHANVLESIRQGRLITPLADWVTVMMNALLALAPILWLPRLRPLHGLLASGLWFMGVTGLAMLLPQLAGIWLAPSAALVAIVLAYPVWSWRKLESAGRFLDQQLRRLHQDAAWVERRASGSREQKSEDPLQSRIEQVQAASIRLAQLQEHRRETLAFISHDIRAPLASALMHLEENNGASTDQLRGPLQHAFKLAEDFLHTSRAEMADARDFRELDLASVLHQALDDAYASAKKKSVALVRDIPSEPVWLDGDFGLLHRAVLNLVLNAIKFSPPDASVTLALDTSESDVVITVTDHGCGIPFEQQEKLFQRFSRSENTDNINEGVGLGLYFVRTVVEKHGGSVKVECEIGSHTTFTMRLPTDQRTST